MTHIMFELKNIQKTEWKDSLWIVVHMHITGAEFKTEEQQENKISGAQAKLTVGNGTKNVSEQGLSEYGRANRYDRMG